MKILLKSIGIFLLISNIFQVSFAFCTEQNQRGIRIDNQTIQRITVIATFFGDYASFRGHIKANSSYTLCSHRIKSVRVIDTKNRTLASDGPYWTGSRYKDLGNVTIMHEIDNDVMVDEGEIGTKTTIRNNVTAR